MKVRISRPLAEDLVIDSEDLDIHVDPNTGSVRIDGLLNGDRRTLAAVAPGQWLAAEFVAEA